MKDPAQIIEIEKKLYEYDGEDKIVSSHALKRELEAKKKKAVAFRSNIPTLDEMIHGFEGGEITVISGVTKQGKTLLAQSLTLAMAEQKVHSLWFTYEVPPLQFLRQFGEELPLFYLPQLLKGNALGWIRQRVHEAKVKCGIQAVFIDHLHFIVDMGTKNNMSLEIGMVMRTLKKLALEFNICIFIIAHTQKIKPDAELDTDSLRDSSFIGQEADNVLFIWRKKKGGVVKDEAVLKIAANRRMGVMGKKIALIKVGNYLREVEDVERD